MDIKENKDGLYINGKQMSFSLERLMEILKVVKENIPKAFESIDRDEAEGKMDDIIDELNNL